MLCNNAKCSFITDKYCQCQNGDRKIPLLRSVFEEFPNIPINLDVKAYNEELIELVSGHCEDVILLRKLLFCITQANHKASLFYLLSSISLSPSVLLTFLQFKPGVHTRGVYEHGTPKRLFICSSVDKSQSKTIGDK